MIKKLTLIALIFLGSTIIHAGDCLVLNERVNKKAVDIIPRWGLAVKSKQRVYFHSAPNASCKIKDLLFIMIVSLLMIAIKRLLSSNRSLSSIIVNVRI